MTRSCRCSTGCQLPVDTDSGLQATWPAADTPTVTPWRAVLAILLGLLISQPTRRKREREATNVGETVGLYVVERARAADKQQRIMLIMTAVSCVAAVAAAVAAFLAVIG